MSWEKNVSKQLSLCLTSQALRHEGIWGSRCIDPSILDLGTSWKWVDSFTPRPLFLRRKSPQYLLDRKIGGPQNWSGRAYLIWVIRRWMNIKIHRVQHVHYKIKLLRTVFWPLMGIIRRQSQRCEETLHTFVSIYPSMALQSFCCTLAAFSVS
jgi:hypothetical protein